MYVCSMSLCMYMMSQRCRKKEERHLTDLRQWKNENEICLRWDLNSVLQTDALPAEQPS